MAAKAKEVIEKIEAKAEKVEAKVKVELVAFNKGIHTVYHKLGETVFENGVAEVDREVAKVLKELGLVK